MLSPLLWLSTIPIQFSAPDRPTERPLLSLAPAKGPDGPETIEIFGDSFFAPPLVQQNPELPLASSQSGIAKGFGNATFTSQSLTTLGGDHDCPLFGDPELIVPVDITSTVVPTYRDGSQLSLAGVAEACNNEAANRFELLFLEEECTALLGYGPRFEGASGSWGGRFTVEGSRLRGDVILSSSFN